MLFVAKRDERVDPGRAVGGEQCCQRRHGACRTGSTAVGTSSLPASPNLRYDGLHIVTKVDVGGKTLEFLLDTGNQAGTQLWDGSDRISNHS